VVDAAEAVRNDGDHGQAESDGKVGEGFGFCDRNQPTTGAFDEERGVLGGKFAEPVDERIERESAVFELRGDERSGGGLEPDGVGFVEGESISRGGAEDYDIGAFAAAEGLEGDGAEAGLAEGAGEERGGKGFADAGVGAGEEEVHAKIRDIETCYIVCRTKSRFFRQAPRNSAVLKCCNTNSQLLLDFWKPPQGHSKIHNLEDIGINGGKKVEIQNRKIPSRNWLLFHFNKFKKSRLNRINLVFNGKKVNPMQ